MSKKEYNVYDIVTRLKKKADLDIEGNVIRELSRNYSKGDVGIKSKGYIDFLTRYHGYLHYYVDKF